MLEALAMSLIISLILTIVVEVTVSLFLGVWEPEDTDIVVRVNCITNPVVVTISFFVQELSGSMIAKYAVLIVLEVLVVWTETKMYRRWLTACETKPFKLALVLNVFSFGLGVVLDILCLL
ncbi:MAG: hypothetical protein IKX54_05485 [Lachnospiraceae bacterium]|nr:hypothetical protein [Lachnospiraceae bacterium]